MRKIIILIISIITTLCTSLVLLGGKFLFFGNDFKWIMLLIIVYAFLDRVYKTIDKRRLICSLILGFLLAIMYYLGYLAGDLFVTTTKLYIYVFCKALVYFIIGSTIIYLIYGFIPNLNMEEKKFNLFTNNIKSIFFVAFLLMLAYLPYILYYCPGSVLIDSSIQILQGAGLIQFTNHHPALHTLIIKCCMSLGILLGRGYQLGALIYTILQSIFTAFIFSYSIYYMAKKGIPKYVRVLALLFFAFCPTICFYTITMYKDIPFSLMMLLVTIGTTELVTNTEEFLKSKWKIFFLTLFVLLAMFFRNNGVYAFILAFPFFLIVMRKHWKYIIIIFLVPIILFEVISKPGYALIGIKQGSPREALTIPIQQFARLMVFREKDLTDEEKAKIREYIVLDDFTKTYDHAIVDSTKAYFSDDNYNNDKSGFFKLYLQLAKKYPKETFESFILGNYGYYYPNTLGWGVYTGIDQQFFIGHEDIIDIHPAPLVKFTFLDEINKFVNTRDIPIISTLINIGFLFWLLLLCMMYCIYKKTYKNLLLYLPVFFLWATVLAGPIFAEPRYVYCLFTCMPIFLGVTFFKNKNEEPIKTTKRRTKKV